MNPEDMQQEGIAEGDLVRVSSDAGAIEVPATADPDLRRGVIAITHGFGRLPGEPSDPRVDGASTNLLISSKRDRESINAMPRMSGIPVNVSRAQERPTAAT
jgi:anaerobic selenocysteine-containing dehydrogenase